MVLILFAASARFQKVSAASNPQFLLSNTIDPGKSTITLEEGQDFTVTVNLTDDSDLFLWQVVLTYNGSVLNLTNVFLPPDGGVFAGHLVVPVEQAKDWEAMGDFVTGLNFTMFGASLLGFDSVSVTNGVLLSANFTAITTGTTTITLMTYANPVSSLGAPGSFNCVQSYSYVQNSDLDTDYDFETIGVTIIIGEVDVPPVAFFTVIPPHPDNKTNLVIKGTMKSGTQNPVFTFANYTTLFNATASYAPVGNITQYIWNFGDGNVTTVDATANASKIISHVYKSIGTFQVTLTVVGSGVPEKDLPPMSNSYTATALVGLALPLYDWTPFIYTLLGIIAALIVIYAIRSGSRRLRRQRRLKAAKLAAAGLARQPATPG
jgi:hypothetical protein